LHFVAFVRFPTSGTNALFGISSVPVLRVTFCVENDSQKMDEFFSK